MRTSSTSYISRSLLRSTELHTILHQLGFDLTKDCSARTFALLPLGYNASSWAVWIFIEIVPVTIIKLLLELGNLILQVKEDARVQIAVRPVQSEIRIAGLKGRETWETVWIVFH